MKYFGCAVLAIGLMVLVLPFVGAMGYRVEIWDHNMGMAMVIAGIFLSVVGLLGGIIGLICLLVGRQMDFISFFLIGVALSIGWASYIYVKYAEVQDLPLTNDVSTDVWDPPKFIAIVGEREMMEGISAYTDQKRELQQEGYPDLTTLYVPLSIEDSFYLASKIIKRFEWELVSSDPEAGILEATDTTFWFGFKDDIVIRIRASNTGSLIDVRSASRKGVSDLGVNAQRVQKFLTEFERPSPQQLPV